MPHELSKAQVLGSGASLSFSSQGRQLRGRRCADSCMGSSAGRGLFAVACGSFLPRFSLSLRPVAPAGWVSWRRPGRGGGSGGSPAALGGRGSGAGRRRAGTGRRGGRCRAARRGRPGGAGPRAHGPEREGPCGAQAAPPLTGAGPRELRRGSAPGRARPCGRPRARLGWVREPEGRATC